MVRHFPTPPSLLERRREQDEVDATNRVPVDMSAHGGLRMFSCDLEKTQLNAAMEKQEAMPR
eukprot:12904477-Prorocentrum_lima.AAC.1